MMLARINVRLSRLDPGVHHWFDLVIYALDWYTGGNLLYWFVLQMRYD